MVWCIKIVYKLNGSSQNIYDKLYLQIIFCFAPVPSERSVCAWPCIYENALLFMILKHFSDILHASHNTTAKNKIQNLIQQAIPRCLNMTKGVLGFRSEEVMKHSWLINRLKWICFKTFLKIVNWFWICKRTFYRLRAAALYECLHTALTQCRIELTCKWLTMTMLKHLF